MKHAGEQYFLMRPRPCDCGIDAPHTPQGKVAGFMQSYYAVKTSATVEKKNLKCHAKNKGAGVLGSAARLNF